MTSNAGENDRVARAIAASSGRFWRRQLRWIVGGAAFYGLIAAVLWWFGWGTPVGAKRAVLTLAPGEAAATFGFLVGLVVALNLSVRNVNGVPSNADADEQSSIEGLARQRNLAACSSVVGLTAVVVTMAAMFHDAPNSFSIWAIPLMVGGLLVSVLAADATGVVDEVPDLKRVPGVQRADKASALGSAAAVWESGQTADGRRLWVSTLLDFAVVSAAASLPACIAIVSVANHNATDFSGIGIALCGVLGIGVFATLTGAFFVFGVIRSLAAREYDCAGFLVVLGFLTYLFILCGIAVIVVEGDLKDVIVGASGILLIVIPPLLVGRGLVLLQDPPLLSAKSARRNLHRSLLRQQRIILRVDNEDVAKNSWYETKRSSAVAWLERISGRQNGVEVDVDASAGLGSSS